MQADGERELDELTDVVGDALVGVIGCVALKLHAIVHRLRQPFDEISARHPAPPADLEPLVEIELIDGEQDEGGGENAEIAELVDEGVPVVLLERVVEDVVPGVEQDAETDQRQFDRDDGREQDAAGPSVLG